ncbi:ankyrin repeat-containing domain protein [Mycena maculata]|uniref:Ankyrin repeat-containing domain protein n=1 Tax=Mycena maculata TaxID=230809 RepID=A0AAD7IRF3_9AGAR|nr:ankyrin repeat-containing domain protein [Mycena maculata]
MAEALGTVASILQLVDTALTVREYIQDFRHAPQEQRRLLSEMDDLRPIIEELRRLVAANPTSPAIKQMTRPVDAFKSTMEEFTAKLREGKGSFAKFRKQLTWTLWNKKEATEYLDKFQQFKTLVNSWLLVDIREAGQERRAVLDSVDNVVKHVTRINDAAVAQQEQIDSRKRTEILDWLSPINFFLRHADISRTRQPGTGEWFLADSRFKKWESGAGGPLWCRGIPGAGKTVLASMVVNHLSVQSQTENIGVACIYLDHKETEIQTPSNLLSALWRQLVLGKGIGSLAHSIYQQHCEKCTRPSLDDVQAVLFSVIVEWLEVYIVVDAIDEYPEDERHTLLEHLLSMGPTVHLMTTSRPHITFSSLRNFESIDIRANPDDIQRYVDGRMQTSSRLAKHVETQPELHEEIHSKIVKSADGMFLLAKLHIESLSTKPTVKGVREALANLPKNLQHTYDNAMKRINEQNPEDREIALSALTWVANAKRPLSVQELREALAIEPGATRLDVDNILDIEIILSVCAGLVITDAKVSVVRLVHYTAQDYLNNVQTQRFPNAQTDIARTLFTSLAFDQPSFRHHNAPALLGYAQYCLAHAAGEPERPLRDMIVKFLGQASKWRCSMRWRWDSGPWNFPWPLNVSPLWIAAAANLVETAEYLLLEGPPIPERPNRHEVGELHVASYYGHLGMVRCLIDHGADMNARGGLYTNAIHPASEMGHEDVVRFLIEKDVQLNLQARYESTLQMLFGQTVTMAQLFMGGKYGGALQAASSKGHQHIILLLLEGGADVNGQGGEHGSAVQAASSKGHGNIVQLLIENGADVNMQRGKYGSALQQASFNGHLNVVQLLIENGADVNAQDGQFGNALRAASFKGHKKIVQLLIKHGADVNAQGGEYGNALQDALCRGNQDIARLLIENGAEVNAQGGHYGNALQTASSMGQENMVRWLIQNGADVNAQGGRYGSALQAASFKGHGNIARLLINIGADVNMQGGKYGNALKAASLNGDGNIVRLLIEAGAEMNTHHSTCSSALQEALYTGNTARALLLIQNGANVNEQGRRYGTALHIASWMGHKAMIRPLIDHGAGVNTQGGRYGSALQAASCMGHETIVRQLIENSADVNAQGGLDGSALQAACFNGHMNIVQLLIEKGADVNVHGGQYGTPLQVALHAGNEDLVRLLIKSGADVNAQYGGALQLAGLAGNEDIARLLIKQRVQLLNRPT